MVLCKKPVLHNELCVLLNILTNIKNVTFYMPYINYFKRILQFLIFVQVNAPKFFTVFLKCMVVISHFVRALLSFTEFKLSFLNIY